MRRRYAVSLPAFAALILVLTLAATRCGSDKKDDAKRAPTPPATPKTTGGTTEVSPTDWDGNQDWSNSTFEVIEE